MGSDGCRPRKVLGWGAGKRIRVAMYYDLIVGNGVCVLSVFVYTCDVLVAVELS